MSTSISVCRAEDIAALLGNLVRQPAGPTPEIPLDIRIEAGIAAQELADMQIDDMLGTPSRFTCPECHGALWEIEDGSMLRFRCHVGHAFTADTVLASQGEEIDRLLGTLLRSHQERAALAHRMAERERASERHVLAQHLETRARDYEHDVEIMKKLLRNGAVGTPGRRRRALRGAARSMKPETNRPQKSGPSRNGPTKPIVGIGASAGGIGALETLVPLFERGAGLAYVVVQHLDPERKSMLTGLLRRTAKIPVTEIADQVTIEADHVYVIPPNAALAISDKRLKISPPVEQRFQRTPIDGFFISLAEANGECSAGVILSGTGSDGTIGLRAIKEHGGLTVAQDDAEYDGMMRSAVAAAWSTSSCRWTRSRPSSTTISGT